MTSIAINIRTTFDAQKRIVIVKSNSKVEDIMKEIEKYFNIPLIGQKLIFKGRILYPEEPITSYKIENDCTIILVKICIDFQKPQKNLDNNNMENEIEKYKRENNQLKEKIEKLKEDNRNLNNELFKANKIITNINNQQKIENQNININELQRLKEEIKFKEKRIKDLKIELENERNKINNKFVNYNDVMVVYFTSTDQIINNFGIKCLKTETFAEVEDKLYKEFDEFRETNNAFIVNGQPILRFKKLYENNIKDGNKIQLIKNE